MDNGQSVVLDSIKNEELRKGLRELFDMMRLGKEGKYKVRSSDRGLMMRTFGDRLKEIEACPEQLKKSKSNEESASSVEPPKETSESTSASAPKKTRLGPARFSADWKPTRFLPRKTTSSVRHPSLLLMYEQLDLRCWQK